MTEWIQFVQGVGFPITAALAMGYAIYRTGQWLVPRLDSHLTESAKTQAELRDAVRTLAVGQESITGPLKEIHHDVKEIKGKVL